MRFADTLDANCEPTLVIDVDGAVAKQLADQLNDSGLAADTAVSRSAALGALRAKHYGAMVFVGDVGDPEHLQCIAELRKRALRTWLLMISSTEPHYPRDLFLRYGIDALIVIPFSMKDLLFRLMAFSLRSRPP
jgi:DNA-binding response OmpR family regulator